MCTATTAADGHRTIDSSPFYTVRAKRNAGARERERGEQDGVIIKVNENEFGNYFTRETFPIIICSAESARFNFRLARVSKFVLRRN